MLFVYPDEGQYLYKDKDDSAADLFLDPSCSWIDFSDGIPSDSTVYKVYNRDGDYVEFKEKFFEDSRTVAETSHVHYLVCPDQDISTDDFIAWEAWSAGFGLVLIFAVLGASVGAVINVFRGNSH